MLSPSDNITTYFTTEHLRLFILLKSLQVLKSNFIINYSTPCQPASRNLPSLLPSSLSLLLPFLSTKQLNGHTTKSRDPNPYNNYRGGTWSLTTDHLVFKSYLCALLAVWLQVLYSIVLCLNFPLCQKGSNNAYLLGLLGEIHLVLEQCLAQSKHNNCYIIFHFCEYTKH